MTGAFHREDGSLYCENVDLESIASSTFTPFYLYSHDVIKGKLREFQKGFENHDGLVAYALKANSNKALVNLIGKRGAGADVVSGGELYRALKAGIPANRIVFAGVGKKRKEIRYALEEGILGFNVESLSELEAIDEIADESSNKAPIAIRVKPEVGSEAHPYLSTGDASSKFGVSRTKALKGFEIAKSSKNLEPVGVHSHIGSQIDSTEVYQETASFIGKMVDKLTGKGINLKYVDFGGGFGIGMGSTGGNSVPDTKDFISALLTGFGNRSQDYRLLVEPGRAIVGPSGVLIGKVIRRKETSNRTFLVTDVGMNDLIRPALYGSQHEIAPLNLGPGRNQKENVDVVGPLCESGDFIARNRELPRLGSGEYFVVFDTGAYGRSMASNYNSRPIGPEVLVRGSSYEIIKERESVKDLVSRERSPSFL